MAKMADWSSKRQTACRTAGSDCEFHQDVEITVLIGASKFELGWIIHSYPAAYCIDNKTKHYIGRNFFHW